MVTELEVSREDFESLENYRNNPDNELRWETVFVLPAWLKVWWQNFGSGGTLFLRSVKQGKRVIGIAPLQIRNGEAFTIGSSNVCDYQDFITVPGVEVEFFKALLGELQRENIQVLNLDSVRPDSSITKYLIPLARELKCEISFHQSDVSLDMELPDNWEGYLSRLDGKQRHELRRKMRNLQEAGGADYYVIENKDDIPAAIENFLLLFPESRKDKAEFMNSDMQVYFRSLALALSDINIIKFGVLEITGRPVAMVMYFDYHDNIYLYNSAYVPEYKHLSVGIISKARSIQDSINKRKKRYDFLKGSERYKYYLGGQEIPLYNYQIVLPGILHPENL